MGETTAIQWTHHTFNPWIGCTKVHTGCTNCYAEAQNRRWAYNGGVWGKGAERKVTSTGNWAQPAKWARAAAKAGERRRVFCASLADVLDEEAPAEAQARLWGLIRECSKIGWEEWEGSEENITRSSFGLLDWLILTKRPERWQLIPEDVRQLVWLGTSVSNQETANEWVPRLLDAEGFAKRFLSIEPQVGPVDLSAFMGGAYVALPGDTIEPSYNFGIDWVIVGGESGPGARRCSISWIESVIHQCSDAGVPCFVKQLGSHHMPNDIGVTDRKGGDLSEWPEHLRVREFPAEDP